MPQIAGISSGTIHCLRKAPGTELTTQAPLGPHCARVTEDSSTRSTTSPNSTNIAVTTPSPSWVQSHPKTFWAICTGLTLVTGLGTAAGGIAATLPLSSSTQAPPPPRYPSPEKPLPPGYSSFEQPSPPANDSWAERRTLVSEICESLIRYSRGSQILSCQDPQKVEVPTKADYLQRIGLTETERQEYTNTMDQYPFSTMAIDHGLPPIALPRLTEFKSDDTLTAFKAAYELTLLEKEGNYVGVREYGYYSTIALERAIAKEAIVHIEELIKSNPNALNDYKPAHMTTTQFIEVLKLAYEPYSYNNRNACYQLSLELRIHNTTEMRKAGLLHHQPIPGHSHLKEDQHPDLCISPTVDVASLERGELTFVGHTQFKQNATLWSLNPSFESQYIRELLAQNITGEVLLIIGETLPDSRDKYASLWSPTRTYHASWPINLTEREHQDKIYAWLKLCWYFRKPYF